MKTLVVVLTLMAVLTPACATTGYPYTAIDVPDPWGFLTRESTSYAAWYLNSVVGERWINTQPGRGSARYWDEIAATLNQQGGNWLISQTPNVGAVVSWKGPLYAGDQWGHVAVVEGVNSDGTIDLSEYNWVSYSYSFRTHVDPGRYGAYVYIYHPVPEPSSLVALGSLVAPLVLLRRKRG